MRPATSTLRPRSGKEYQNIDRSMLSLSQHMHHHHQHHPSSNLQPSQMRGLLNCSVNYANITPVPENAESPSPGYQSGSSPQEAGDGANLFLYKVRYSATAATMSGFSCENLKYSQTLCPLHVFSSQD